MSAAAPAVTGRLGTSSGDRIDLVLGTDDLRAAQVADFARRPGRYHLVLDLRHAGPEQHGMPARDRMVDTGQPRYAATGDMDPRWAGAPPGPVRYQLAASGPLAGPDVLRATLLVRLNWLARGHHGVRREVLELLRDCLSHNVLPMIPEYGPMGADGDLAPLCHLADLLTGEGEALVGGVRRPARRALAVAGLAPIHLAPGEGLALLHGAAFMTGLATLAAADARELVGIAEVATALAVDVLRADPDHFQPAAHRHKAHPGQLASAGAVRALLAGSRLSRPGPAGPPPGPADPPAGSDGPDPVRNAPAVLGALRDTLDRVDRWLAAELNPCAGSPLVDPATDAALTGGGSYGGQVRPAMDTLRVAVAGLGDLLDRQFNLVMDDKQNNGLPAGLVPADADRTDGATLDGFPGARIAGSALVAEVLRLATPGDAGAGSAEPPHQDVVAAATGAARDTRTVVELVREIAALHLAALAEGADLRGAGLLAPGTRAGYDLVRTHVPADVRDRRLDRDLTALTAALRDGALSRAVTGVLRAADRPVSRPTGLCTPAGLAGAREARC